MPGGTGGVVKREDVVGEEAVEGEVVVVDVEGEEVGGVAVVKGATAVFSTHCTMDSLSAGVAPVKMERPSRAQAGRAARGARDDGSS